MNKITTGTLLFASMAMVGCISSYDYVEDAQGDRFEQRQQFENDFGGNMILSEGSIQGEIGRVQVDTRSPNLNGFDDGSFAYVEVMGAGSNGVAMNVIEIGGGLDQLEDGVTGTFAYEDYFESEDALRVMSLGCSGDEAYAWDYDQPATETEIAVLEVDQGLQIDYTSRTERLDPMTGVSTGEMQSSSGSFVIER